MSKVSILFVVQLPVLYACAESAIDGSWLKGAA